MKNSREAINEQTLVKVYLLLFLVFFAFSMSACVKTKAVVSGPAAEKTNESVIEAPAISEEQCALIRATDGSVVAKCGNSTISILGKSGDKGDKGDKGDRGEKGDKGDTGETGTNGVDGLTGQAGINGQNGSSCTLSRNQNNEVYVTCGNSSEMISAPTENNDSVEFDNGRTLAVVRSTVIVSNSELYKKTGSKTYAAPTMVEVPTNLTTSNKSYFDDERLNAYLRFYTGSTTIVCRYFTKSYIQRIRHGLIGIDECRSNIPDGSVTSTSYMSGQIVSTPSNLVVSKIELFISTELNSDGAELYVQGYF
jgi:hypothetical protein